MPITLRSGLSLQEEKGAKGRKGGAKRKLRIVPRYITRDKPGFSVAYKITGRGGMSTKGKPPIKYEVGKTYVHAGKLGFRSGFHFSRTPMECLDFVLVHPFELYEILVNDHKTIERNAEGFSEYPDAGVTAEMFIQRKCSPEEADEKLTGFQLSNFYGTYCYYDKGSSLCTWDASSGTIKSIQVSDVSTFITNQKLVRREEAERLIKEWIVRIEADSKEAKNCSFEEAIDGSRHGWHFCGFDKSGVIPVRATYVTPLSRRSARLGGDSHNFQITTNPNEMNEVTKFYNVSSLKMASEILKLREYWSWYGRV